MVYRRTRGARLSVAVVISAVLCALAIGACGGQSQEQKAQKAICGARSNIEKSVKSLEGITLSVSSVDQLKQTYDSIKSNVQVIRDNAGKLSGARKQKVTSAVDEFGQELQSVASGLTSSLNLSSASSQIRAAVTKLEGSARSAFAPLDCS